MTLISYIISPAVVQVQETEWREPVLVWLSVNIPTGISKSSLYQFVHGIITRDCGCNPRYPSWLLGKASCEKMGEWNGDRLLGLYDELSTFLNLYQGKGLNIS